MKNRFDELNNKMLNKCKSVREIQENSPFTDLLLDEKNCSGNGLISTIGGVINVYNNFSRNLLNKINKFNKNDTNIRSGSGQWTKLLKENSIDEMVSKVNFNRFSIQHYLNHLKNECNMTFEQISERSNHKESYIKPVFNIGGSRKRNPSRDCIIGLAFAFQLNTFETNYLLKAEGFNELYLRDKRDLIIAKGLFDSMNIGEINKYLKNNSCIKIGNLDEDEGVLKAN